MAGHIVLMDSFSRALVAATSRRQQVRMVCEPFATRWSAIGIASAGAVLGEPLVADHAQIVPLRLARSEEANHDRDEKYAAGHEPPRLHGGERVRLRTTAQLDNIG